MVNLCNELPGFRPFSLNPDDNPVSVKLFGFSMAVFVPEFCFSVWHSIPYCDAKPKTAVWIEILVYASKRYILTYVVDQTVTSLEFLDTFTGLGDRKTVHYGQDSETG